MDRWLLTKGVSRLESDFTFENGKFATFKVNQFIEKNGDDVLRVHVMDVALYYSTDKVVHKEILV